MRDAKVPRHAETRSYVVQIRVHLGQRGGAAEQRGRALVVGVHELVAGQDGVVDVVTEAQVQRQLGIHVTVSWRIDAGSSAILLCGGSDGHRVGRRIGAGVVDVEDPVGREAPAALLRRIDVHHERLALQLKAELKRAARDESEVVGEAEHAFPFGSACRLEPKAMPGYVFSE